MATLTPEQRAEHHRRREATPRQADPSTKQRHYSEANRKKRAEKWQRKKAARQARAGGSAEVAESSDLAQDQSVPAPGTDNSDSESSDANVVIADAGTAPTSDLEGTVLASTAAASSSDAPPHNFVPTGQMVQHKGTWWFRPSPEESWQVFRDSPASDSGLAAKGGHKGKRKRGHHQ